MSSLAVKYRPSNFYSLIGQDAIKNTLSLALNQDKLADSYLFSGLRGSGKTSTARIFAKSIICEKGISSNPCEECNSCNMMKSSTHIDVIEIDGASNRKIDDVREIIENIKYRPSIAKYKIYIIDEVHMLTKEAFNALLKTLEEPPSFIKFILATTDPLKVPITIRSRTQHFHFRRIPESIIVKHLINICEKENSQYQKDGLEIIAKNSGGSLRDSITMLEQAIRYSNSNITLKSASDMLGVINPTEIQKLMENILSNNKDKVLNFIEDFMNFEEDMILKEILSNLKYSLYLEGNPKAIPLNKIEIFFNIISESLILMENGNDKNFILTLTLLKMMDLENKIENKIKLIEKEEPKEEEREKTEKIEKIIVKKPEPIKSGNEQFTILLEKIKEENIEIGNIFQKNIKYLSFENKILILELNANNENKVYLRKNWNIIKDIIENIYGIDITIKVNTVKNIEKKIPDEMLNEKMVKKAIELFLPTKIKILKKNI